MRAWRIMGLTAAVILLSSSAGARAGGWRVGVGIGGPCCGFGCYRPCGFGLGVGLFPSVVVAPSPVIYEGAPVVYQPAPVVVQSPPAPQTLPVPAESSPRLPPPRSSSEPPAIPSEEEQSVADERLSQLHAPTEKARINAALELGRDRIKQAVPALSQVLKTDSSAHVRDAAARALGLIGSARCLNALQTAALADDDREVRHSAQFAAEVIRSRLRGR